ncbi:NUDIX domain-containing protein [Candidatus Roizmanbacteria bacterium]|nr:NUDIX domain-containing protein [Candidatus Roizmanbacteria bacterium]
MRQIHKLLTVFIGCVIQDNRVLMVQRNEPVCKDAHLKWELPGGKLDIGESPETCVVREIFEETGRRVKIERLIPQIQVNNWRYPWGVQQTVIICYRCRYLSQNASVKDHHVLNVEWIPIAELSKKRTLSGTETFVKLALE